MTGRPALRLPVPPPPQTVPATQMRGADLVLRILEAEGVEVCFGMPGGAILPIYDAIARGTTVRHVLARHEQGAGHMAQGYARASGRPGVVFATSGPGATNLVTPIADAAMDSTPLVCITGQVSTEQLGTDAFQECDIIGITIPIVRHSWMVRHVEQLADILRAAFVVATSGRPGPVLVDIPRDVQEALVTPAAPCRTVLAGFEGPPALDMASVGAAAAMLARAGRPVLYAGGGVVNAGASRQLLALAERMRSPVVTTLMGKGAMPESHELFAGWPGMHGTQYANLVLNRADVVVAVGARFDDRVTGRLDRFAEGARIIHFDVDPYEIGKVRQADVAIIGPLVDALEALYAAVDTPNDTSAWLRQVDAWKREHPLRYGRQAGRLKPQAVLQRLDARLRREDAVYTTGVGQHQMWAMQYLRCDRPRSFITSGGHGTMGFGLPAAIGARAARPDAAVVCVDGDGSFQMTLQELATAVAEDLAVVVVVLNNETLGMVCQWQSLFYEGRRSEVHVTSPTSDFALVARGLGADGFTARTLEELDAALDRTLASGRTTLIDVRVQQDEHCLPMIPPRRPATDMLQWRPPDA